MIEAPPIIQARRPFSGGNKFQQMACSSWLAPDGEDFRVYRRNKRETIPIICPPES